MRRFILLLCALCLALPVLAERKVRFGDLDVHYSAFNSSFLQPEVAAASGLVRSNNQGVLNIAVLRAGQNSQARVEGEVTDLLGKRLALQFREVRDGSAIYYLAQFPVSQREVLRFNLSLQVGEGLRHQFDFTQEVFPDAVQ